MRFWILLMTVAVASQACQQESKSGAGEMPETTEGYFAGNSGVRLFYRTIGSAPDTVIVLHGGPGVDMEYLISDLEPLAQSHTVVYYDQLGAGRSELPADSSKLTIDQYVQDLEHLRTFLGLDKVTLVGHSFGALLANFYSRDYPENVKRLVLIGGLPPSQGDFFTRYAENLNAHLTEEEQTRMRELDQQIISGTNVKEACSQLWAIGLKPRFTDLAKIAEMNGDLCAAPPEALIYAMAKTRSSVWASIGAWDLRAGLADFSAPTLLIHGDAEAIPMDMMEEWLTVLPNARLLRVPDAGHFPYIENPEVVWPAMEEFLNGGWPKALNAVATSR
jgi:proline iminopeptidase